MFGGVTITFLSERARNLAAQRLGGILCARHWSVTVTRADSATFVKTFRRLGLVVSVDK